MNILVSVALFLGVLLGQSVAMAQPLRTSYAPPKQVALRLTDMPVGFTQSEAEVDTNTIAAKHGPVPLATLVRHGRLNGYDVTYKKGGTAGLLEVENAVIVYQSAAGAHWQLEYSEARAKKSYQGHKVAPMPVGSLGRQSAGYRFSEKTKGFNITDFFVILRRGRYVAIVQGLGISGTFRPGQVVNLARTEATRMSHAK